MNNAFDIPQSLIEAIAKVRSQENLIVDKQGLKHHIKHWTQSNDKGQLKHHFELYPDPTSLVPEGASRGAFSSQLITNWKGDEIMYIGTHPSYQRRGLATAIKTHAENVLGNPLSMGWAMTPDGEQFNKSLK